MTHTKNPKNGNSHTAEEHCSFCGKHHSEVLMLFQGGSGARICNECIEQGYHTLVEHHVVADPLSATPQMQQTPLHYEELLKPAQIKEMLDQYVIGQEAAKRYLSVAVYNHYKRILSKSADAEAEIEIDKSNVVLVGPTGTGKTLMARTIARLLNVPFTIVDATVLTEAGYVGEDVESILSRLLQVASYDVAAAERGIVFIDEIDKIAGRRGGSGPDVSREGVQRDILPIVEGSTVNTKYGPVKTDYMLFIAAGAFHVAKVSDLIPELQGRFPVHVQLKSLTREDFQRILTQPDNALTLQYKALLAVDKVMLTFEDSAIEAIANAAFTANETAEDIGARRLHAVFEQVLEDISFNAGDENMPPFELTINGEYVQQHLSGENKPTDLRKYIL